MWLVLSDAYLSIVADPKHPTKLLVRGRLPNDIKAVFPTAELFTKMDYDYKYRALVERTEVAKVIAAKLTAIDYTNFKDTVPSGPRHDAYFRIWHDMYAIQE